MHRHDMVEYLAELSNYLANSREIFACWLRGVAALQDYAALQAVQDIEEDIGILLDIIANRKDELESS